MEFCRHRPRHRHLVAALTLLAVIALVRPPEAHSQSSRTPPATPGVGDDRTGASAPPAAEWTILGGGATALEIAHSRADREFALAAVSWVRTVTRRRGPGALAGSLAVGVEAVPVFLMFQSDRAFGAGASPVVLRWNFAGPARLRPFAEIAGGFIRTNRPVPEGTARFNFTTHLGGGVRLRLDRARALVVGYRLHHLSNGGRLRTNPGVNSMFFYSGISFAR